MCGGEMKNAWILLLVGAAACGPEVRARPLVDADSVSTTASAPAPTPASSSSPSPSPSPSGIPAVLFSDLDADLGARMTGVVKSVEVEMGDTVKEGHVLLALDDAREQARVEAA